MTDYNDGQIHGWNGGECPVHPKTVVCYWVREGSLDGECADNLTWVHRSLPSDIVAFRVTSVHREPKVIWVNEYPLDVVAFYDEHDARKSSNRFPLRTAVKYQEVIENDR